MNTKQTTKEIKELRNAFRIQYKIFKENYTEIGLRLFNLTKQADLLLNVIEQLNETEIGINGTINK